MQDAQWWYANSRQSEGPVDLAALRRLQQDGTVTARTLLWREGMPAWRPLAELEQDSTPIEMAPAPDIDTAPPVEVVAPSVGDPSDPYRAPPLHRIRLPPRGWRARWPCTPAWSAATSRSIASAGDWIRALPPPVELALAGLPARPDLDDVPQDVPPAAMWVGLLLLISVVETLLDVPEGVSLVITIALSVTTGTFGNTWYWHTANA